ncbi:MAG: co-chaperone GroES [Deltaproteobacteria bacterium]|nr:co-chaperone GroES [Deltaproteobacteria bacterium]
MKPANKLDLEPLFSRIIVKREEVEKVGSIFLPTNSGERKVTEGEVVAVGPGCEVVKAGDTVFYGRYAGFELERNGEKYVAMNEDDVLFRVNK